MPLEPMAPSRSGRRSLRPTRAVLCLLATMLVGQSCPKADPGGRCAVEPVGSFHVFLAGGEPLSPVSSVRFRATVLALLPADDLGLERLRLREDGGLERELAYRLPGGALPVRGDESYDFQVDHVAGAPSASGLLIHDEAGLLFAAASDQSPGGHVLREGVPAFEMELADGDCGSRASDRCHAAIRNLNLNVSHGGRAVRIQHGEQAMLGAHRITCLAAQEVSYREGCADTGLIALSWAITRVGDGGY